MTAVLEAGGIVRFLQHDLEGRRTFARLMVENDCENEKKEDKPSRQTTEHSLSSRSKEMSSSKDKIE